MNLKSVDRGQSSDRDRVMVGLLTWWCIWVVGLEGQPRFEVPAIIEGIWIENDHGNDPFSNVIADELRTVSDKHIRILLDY